MLYERCEENLRLRDTEYCTCNLNFTLQKKNIKNSEENK